MAEIGWSRARQRRDATAPTESSWDRVQQKYFDWEDWLTLALALVATVTVSYGLESTGWTTDMPALTLVSILALASAMFMARSRMSVFSAWPFAVFLGVLVTLWQTLDAVGPGALDVRIENIYDRFNNWFRIALFDTNEVSNDSLPFNTLVVGLTWLGTFLFGWSVFRWHHAWIGLIPGGAALFLGLVFVSDSLSTAVAVYVLFGFLLVMRTHLTKRMAEWRAHNIAYPPMISLSFLHFTTWAMLSMLIFAWIVPVGPFSTPGVVDSAIRRLESVGVDFVRLAGPLHVNKVIPAHNYTGVLPFQGSVELGDREVLLVEVQDPTIGGPIMLRGTVYENYGSGGWTAGDRETIQVPDGTDERLTASLSEAVEEGEVEGTIIPLDVTLQAKSVIGTVLFSPGQTVGSEPAVDQAVPDGSLVRLPRAVLQDEGLIGTGLRLSDDEVIERFVPDWFTGVSVQRDDRNRILYVEGVDKTAGESGATTLPDVAALQPENRIPEGDSYSVTGFVPEVTPDDLRNASTAYPEWVTDQYLSLPGSLPRRVLDEAHAIAGGEATPYDKAKTVETYLRDNYPVDYNLGETPAGKDTVDYFLFEARRGFFDYHASAMSVLLRELGVPARLAVGFVIQNEDVTPEGSYMVRDRNAYAWTEVYFPDHGWIPFNPSPDRPADLTPTERDEALAGDINGDTVIDINDFPNLPVGADPIFGDGFEGLPETPLGGGVTGQPFDTSSPNYTPWVLAVLGAFAAMVVGSAALGWRRSVVGLPFAHATWEKTVRLASLAGHGPKPGQTPKEFAKALQREFKGHRVIESIGEAYERSRFGRGEISDNDQRFIKRQWPHLRSALIGRTISRLLRRRNQSPES